MKLPNVSDAEWIVMKALWEKSPKTSAEIIAELKEHQTWSPKTVQTLISRLVKKGAVTVVKSAPAYQYSAAVSEKDLVGDETHNFVSRVFNGSVGTMVAYFIKGNKFSESEIEELKNILNQKS